MRLDQKYFVPFILVGALITMVFIVISSLNFKAKQQAIFEEKTAEYASLLTSVHPYIAREDSLSLEQLSGNKVVVVFWASWSDRSQEMFAELDQILIEYPEIKVVAALVMDATETAEPIIPAHDYLFIDGTRLFNRLQVPGIPSYILIDEGGDLVAASVGYKGGVTETIPNLFFNE